MEPASAADELWIPHAREAAMQQYWGIASPTLNFRARVADLRAKAA